MRNNSLHESKAQRWRALAILQDGQEALVYVGMSIVQVRDNYQSAWSSVFSDEAKQKTNEIVVQKWMGTADKGKWITQTNLEMP
jgi:hypothetical protein